MKAEIRVMLVTSRGTPEIISKTPEARGEALRSLPRAPSEPWEGTHPHQHLHLGPSASTLRCYISVV